MKKMTPLTPLRFETTIEEKYSVYTAMKDKTYIRIAFTLFIVLYALFSITDYILVPQRFELFFVIRFVLVIPLMLITILLTYTSFYNKCEQYILMFDFILGGLSISWMLILEPLNIIYYGGLFLVFTAGYFALNLNTKFAVISGFIIQSAFILGIIFTGKMDLIVFSASLFLVAENLIGIMGSYQFERFKRNEFLNINNLNEEQVNLQSTVQEKIEEISVAQISTINALAILAESRDKETGEHIERVGEICYKIAVELPLGYYINAVDKAEFCKMIRLASALHDIGKVGIADAILNKPGPLNEEEFATMCTHSRIGKDTLQKLHVLYPNNFFVKLGIEITHYHHEKWDGTGYPEGLKADEIPLSARIMAIADVYDALISKRPYKPPFTHEKAMEIIKNDAGKHFDPALVS